MPAENPLQSINRQRNVQIVSTNNGTRLVQDTRRLAESAEARGIVTRFGSYSLFDHQIQACDVMTRPNIKGLLLYYDMGSGKTLTALAVAENLRLKNIVTGSILSVPNKVQGQFRDTMRNMEIDSRYHKVITHSALSKLSSDELHNKLLVLDEAHKFKAEGFNFHAGQRASKCAKKTLVMTGTPVINFPEEIAPLIHLVDREKSDLLKDNNASMSGENRLKKAFRYTFMTGDPAKEGTWKKDIQGELRRYLGCTTLQYIPDKSSQAYKDAYPTYQEKYVFVKMSKEQTRAQVALASANSNILSSTFATHNRTKIKAFWGKLRVHSSLAYGDKPGKIARNAELTGHQHSKNHRPEKKPKLDAIVAMTKKYVEKDRKVVIYSRFTTEILGSLRTMLRDERISYATIDSTISDDAASAAQGRFNRNEVRVLLLGPSAQVGVDLKNTSAMIIAEPDFNENNIRQAMARAIRTGSHDGSGGIPKHVDVYRYVSILDPDESNVHSSARASYTSADERLLKLTVHKKNMCDKFLKFLETLSATTVSRCKQTTNLSPRISNNNNNTLNASLRTSYDVPRHESIFTGNKTSNALKKKYLNVLRNKNMTPEEFLRTKAEFNAKLKSMTASTTTDPAWERFYGVS